MNKLLLGSLLAMSLSFSAQAELVDKGDFILDTVSGNEWLDLSLTRNVSFQYVLASITTGELSGGGWSVANFDQVKEMVDNGITGTYSLNTAFIPQNSSLQPLMDVFTPRVFTTGGTTYSDLRGYLSGTYSLFGEIRADVSISTTNTGFGQFSNNSNPGNENLELVWGDDRAASSIGTFLVRSSSDREIAEQGIADVNAPLAVGALSMLAAFGLKRRKKK